MNEMMMTEENPKKKLGRGLSALLGDDSPADYADLDKVRATKEVPVEQLRPNRYQPRQDWDQEALESLSASVREKGILQPILVRRDPDQEVEFEIIAGERRWRAAQMAQLHEVPVVIKELTDAESMEIAIIENIQREDLSPIEEAEAYRRLMEEFDYIQESLSKKVGKSRSHVANLMRLLVLPEAVQTLIREGRLSASAARTLINAEDPEALALKIVEEGLSVRAAEELGKKKTKKADKGSHNSGFQVSRYNKSADVLALEDDLSQAIDMAVDIRHNDDGSGTLTIRYEDLDHLDDACRRLTREPLHGLIEDPLTEDEVKSYSYGDEIQSALDSALEDPKEE
ncbi:ParB/RepB/Spo0J family partition protein [Sneathiella marina]|uniref:ParB/RepB/Spo0J family partition protein n=1 Tax=Sneathiella marina TaxID=2950108 RepID=A0ABY4W3L7_9PROT|nr:ParB/RepB/Spo0J family partition protein [Sneathiella marina]USG61411.1 ParB/RepB/Spo0J family partition protein [Sneathiella marina]